MSGEHMFGVGRGVIEESLANRVDEIAREHGACFITLQVEGTRRTQAMNHPHPAFAHMLVASKELGLPRSFPTDLTTHDRDVLARTPIAGEFLWALGASGTHLMHLGAQTRNFVVQWGKRARIETVEDCLGEVRWFHWTGTTLAPLQSWQAKEVLLKSAALRAVSR